MFSVIKFVFGFAIGALLLIAGLYYLKKENDDTDSRKIYGAVAAIGTVILASALVFLIMQSL
ncbi:hypothetical protein [Pseudoramibacter faecis]|uniref:hypothetical protein n=1 Tax=Pseudoramibacter faecis TaxID=3108534 RepID=UPI002E78A2F7|nr:hypothetical protein [Pseudoramibacter sp. HA2172]